jgi:hypothetical protein
MNIKQFQDKFPEFQQALVEGLKVRDQSPIVKIQEFQRIPNTWLVRLEMNFLTDFYIIWVAGDTGDPCWRRMNP